MYDTYSNEAKDRRPDSLRDFVTVLFKRKRIILSMFLSLVITVTLVSFLMPPIYKSSSKILIERESVSEQALLFRLYLPLRSENYDWIKTEIDIITSYPVAARVVEELGLDKIEQKETELSKEEEKEQFMETVEKFQKTLKVENAGKSNVIEVSYEAKDPALAASTVNRVIKTYLEYRSEIYDESDTYKFLDEQMKITEEKLRESEQRRASYKTREQLISPEAQVKILLTKLADYEKSLTTVRTKRIGKEAKLAVIHQQTQTGSELNIPSTEVSDSPSREKYIATIKGELLNMVMQRDRLRQRFKPTYKEIVDLEKNIASAEEIIKAEIKQILEQEQTAIKALQAEEDALQKSVAKINREVGELAQKEYEITQLSRGIDDNREVYSMLLKQREEARLSLAKLERGVKIKVISPAVVPIKPIKPRKRLNVALAMVLGLVGGLGLAFFVEYNDHSVSTVAELEQLSGLRAFGSVREMKDSGLNTQPHDKIRRNDKNDVAI